MPSPWKIGTAGTHNGIVSLHMAGYLHAQPCLKSGARWWLVGMGATSLDRAGIHRQQRECAHLGTVEASVITDDGGNLAQGVCKGLHGQRAFSWGHCCSHFDGLGHLKQGSGCCNRCG